MSVAYKHSQGLIKLGWKTVRTPRLWKGLIGLSLGSSLFEELAGLVLQFIGRDGVGMIGAGAASLGLATMILFMVYLTGLQETVMGRGST